MGQGVEGTASLGLSGNVGLDAPGQYQLSVNDDARHAIQEHLGLSLGVDFVRFSLPYLIAGPNECPREFNVIGIIGQNHIGHPLADQILCRIQTIHLGL